MAALDGRPPVPPESGLVRPLLTDADVTGVGGHARTPLWKKA